MNIKYKRIVSAARKRKGNAEKEKQLLNDSLPKYQIMLPDGDEIKNIEDLFPDSKNNFNDFILEIGFGAGENIVFNALNNPNKAFIGCEVFDGGVVSLIKELSVNNIENVRIWHNDALELITRLPENSLSLVYILHPDPWPKTRHHKRRLINEQFLKLLAAKIMQNGKLLIITDHADYAKAINEVIKQVGNLYQIEEKDFPPITKTKYRLKADQLNIESKYFCLIKPSYN